MIVTQELFKFEHLDETQDGKILGEYRSMGLRPYTLEKAKQFGFDQPFLEACLSANASPARQQSVNPNRLPLGHRLSAEMRGHADVHQAQ